MKQRKLLALIVILSIGCLAFGQSNSISELYNKINELEKRIRALELMMDSDSYNNNINNSITISNNKMLWRKLKVGMNDDEVRKLLGEPLHIQRLTPYYYTWEYSDYSAHSNITFNERGVSGWTEPE